MRGRFGGRRAYVRAYTLNMRTWVHGKGNLSRARRACLCCEQARISARLWVGQVCTCARLYGEQAHSGACLCNKQARIDAHLCNEQARMCARLWVIKTAPMRQG
jgi:hypothetical protein